MEERSHAADAGSYESSYPFAIGNIHGQTGGPEGLARGGNRELRVAIHSARFLATDDNGGIEIFYLGGDPRFMGGSVKGGYRTNARMARADAAP
jgi:hypothetical protein